MKPRPASLVLDIGNTSVCIALMRCERVIRSARVPTTLRDRRQAGAALQAVWHGEQLSDVVVGSVVPGSTATWKRASASLTGLRPLCVDHRVNLSVRLTYPKPHSIGADRLANVCEAAAKYGAPTIVLDCGTATTFDLVAAGKGFIGGVIAPGPMLMTEYLCQRTALLPRVSLPSRLPKAGRNTQSAMRMGILLGYRGMVLEIVEHLQKSTSGFQNASICVTGGYSRWLVRSLGLPWILDPQLTLRGLARIARLNPHPFGLARAIPHRKHYTSSATGEST